MVLENVLNRDFKSAKAGQKWVSDITYIKTNEGFMYLTIILDLYDRKIGVSRRNGKNSTLTI